LFVKFKTGKDAPSPWKGMAAHIFADRSVGDAVGNVIVARRSFGNVHVAILIHLESQNSCVLDLDIVIRNNIM